MSIAWSDVVAIAPALASTPTGIQNYALRFADDNVSDDAWGDPNVANDARAALAAHAATLAQRTAGVGGPVTSESVGPLSRSYYVPDMTQADALFAQTPFGQMYLQLLNLLPDAFVP